MYGWKLLPLSYLCAVTLSVSSHWVKSDHKIDHWTISERWRFEGGKLFSAVSSSSSPQRRFVMMLTLMIIECKIRCEVISLSLHDGKWAFIFHQFVRFSVRWNGLWVRVMAGCGTKHVTLDGMKWSNEQEVLKVFSFVPTSQIRTHENTCNLNKTNRNNGTQLW